MKFKPLPELNRAIEAIEAARKTVFLKKNRHDRASRRGVWVRDPPRDGR